MTAAAAAGFPPATAPKPTSVRMGVARAFTSKFSRFFSLLAPLQFLVDRTGNVVGRYPSTTTPEAIEADIKKYI